MESEIHKDCNTVESLISRKGTCTLLIYTPSYSCCRADPLDPPLVKVQWRWKKKLELLRKLISISRSRENSHSRTTIISIRSDMTLKIRIKNSLLRKKSKVGIFNNLFFIRFRIQRFWKCLRVLNHIHPSLPFYKLCKFLPILNLIFM